MQDCEPVDVFDRSRLYTAKHTASKNSVVSIIALQVAANVAACNHLRPVVQKLIINLTSGLVHTSNFSCAEPNVNDLSSLFELICIRFGA